MAECKECRVERYKLFPDQIHYCPKHSPENVERLVAALKRIADGTEPVPTGDGKTIAMNLFADDLRDIARSAISPYEAP